MYVYGPSFFTLKISKLLKSAKVLKMIAISENKNITIFFFLMIEFALTHFAFNLTTN